MSNRPVSVRIRTCKGLQKLEPFENDAVPLQKLLDAIETATGISTSHQICATTSAVEVMIAVSC